MIVHKLTHENCGNDYEVILGGRPSLGWPQNPLGEDLKLVMTIDNDRLNKKLKGFNFPNGKFMSIFSTYSESRYFLDDVVYFGDSIEFDYIKKGFTKVVLSDSSFLDESSQEEANYFSLQPHEISDYDYPAFSYFSKELPNGLKGCDKLLDEYYFVCQIYSSDVPSKDGGALGLSDSIGYLFLKKNILDDSDAGFFFVQTA
ncbi:DUF1963 domain-containing protein [Lonsdalea iberica]|nr:DUF1963 domain-containing protein [Lonsdalea iberica]